MAALCEVWLTGQPFEGVRRFLARPQMQRVGGEVIHIYPYLVAETLREIVQPAHYAISLLRPPPCSCLATFECWARRTPLRDLSLSP